MSTSSGLLAPAGSRGTTRLVALWVFAAAMGWLEAVVVVYIRGLLGFAHGQPVPAAAETMERFRSLPWLLATEQSREVATLLMLAAVAWLAGSRFLTRIGAFLMIFGIWDLTYYVGLFAQVRWPPSLATMDLLFLIPPHPWWYQPVWLPIAVSCAMIVTGFRLFRIDSTKP